MGFRMISVFSWHMKNVEIVGNLISCRQSINVEIVDNLIL